ncbi:hypothetical protein, partial [Stenotrophomonas sp. HMWF023]|uniref:hypothetical protein n=1 Tax=Stenotrophomonas sp. HMWF023 TaxID=2056859 RepID=UPI001C637717
MQQWIFALESRDFFAKFNLHSKRQRKDHGAPPTTGGRASKPVMMFASVVYACPSAPPLTGAGGQSVGLYGG